MTTVFTKVVLRVCGRSLAGIAGLNPAGGMDLFLVSVALSGRGLCYGPIARPEETYRPWCVIVCHLETLRTRRLWPMLGCCARERERKREREFCLLNNTSKLQLIQQISSCMETAIHRRTSNHVHCHLIPDTQIVRLHSKQQDSKLSNYFIAQSLLEKFIVVEIVKKIRNFDAISRFITIQKSSSSCIQFHHLILPLWRSVLIIFSYLCLRLPSGVLPYNVETKRYCHVCYTSCPVCRPWYNHPWKVMLRAQMMMLLIINKSLRNYRVNGGCMWIKRLN
jgi:hypothetical protein